MALSDGKILGRSLKARMFTTVTASLTVAVSVALMLALLSMRGAGERAFARGSGDAHLLVSRDADPLVSVLNGVFYAGAPRNSIPWAKAQQIMRGFAYDYAIPTSLGDSYRGFPAMGTAYEYFDTFQPVIGQPYRFAEGKGFEKPFEVVAGARVAEELGLQLNDEIFLMHGTVEDGGHIHEEYAFTVVGILERTGSSHDRALFHDLTSTWLLHALDRREAEGTAPSGGEVLAEEDLLEADRVVTGILLRVASRPGSDGSAAMQQAFDRLRRDTSITVASPSNQIRFLFEIVSGIDQIFVGMAAVVMLSGAITIMLALYNSMEQRRRQIAILRVLGASRARVFNLVVTEAAVIGMIGGAAGVALAFVGTSLVASILRARFGLDIDSTVDPRMALFVVTAAVFLAAGAGLVPALAAYRTSVARNLRPIA